MTLEFDQKKAIERLMGFLAVEGTTGQEAAIASAVTDVLKECGVPARAIRHDEAHRQIPLPTQTGNLIVVLPGNRPGPRQLFSTHLDTVPLCAGAVPVRKGNRITPQGKTALGGDNRTGVACLVTMLATVIERDLPHPPMTVLFTVREESGLWGARFVDLEALGKPAYGFNVDGGSPRELTLGAVGADRWEVEIFGKAAHAGVRPERGISSTLIAALALAQVHEEGWFGKVKKGKQEGTSNVGPFGDGAGRCAGQATNVVTDYVKIQGESRSHEASFVTAITRAYADAFRQAARQVTDVDGKHGKVKFTARRDYYPFRIKESSPAVRVAQEAAERVGWSPKLRTTNGGLDANWLTRHGIPTLTFGAGQNNVHTTDEFVNLDDFLDGCRFALALATQPA